MSRLSLRCIKGAFAFFALGIGLGVAFALDRSLGAAMRPLHAELNLWGWVTLLTYGFAYHMLPRFAGRPLRWPRLANAQSWLAIAGVVLVVLAWPLRAAYPDVARAGILLGSTTQLAAAVAFAILIGDLLRAGPETPS